MRVLRAHRPHPQMRNDDALRTQPNQINKAIIGSVTDKIELLHHTLCSEYLCTPCNFCTHFITMVEPALSAYRIEPVLPLTNALTLEQRLIPFVAAVAPSSRDVGSIVAILSSSVPLPRNVC